MSKCRNYVFTLNNYDAADEEKIQAWECRYLVYGREVAPSTGTPHLQGFVVWNSPRSLGGIKKLDARIHWEPAVTCEKAIEYCKKDGEVFEKGDRPSTQRERGAAGGELEKMRWKRIREAAEEGDWDFLRNEEPQVYCNMLQKLEHVNKRAKITPQTRDELDNEWWYGPTGTGKSRTAYEEFPGAFRKDPKERWWDGYTGQDVVIIDDFDKFQVSQGGDMKRWLDHYPFQAAVKGGYMEIRPKKVVITSNYHPSEIWDDSQTLEPILRRVKLVSFGPEPSKFHPLFNPKN